MKTKEMASIHVFIGFYDMSLRISLLINSARAVLYAGAENSYKETF